MILKQKYDSNIKCYVNQYLETFPLIIKDLDFAIILDTGLEACKWIKKLEWIPDYKESVIDYFMNGGSLFLTDKDDNRYVLNKDNMIIGIEKVLDETKGKNMLRNNMLNSYCFSQELCVYIIEKSLCI